MIKLAKPDISDRAIEKVVEILRSGNLVSGKYVNEFENEVKDYLNVRHAFTTSSGTAALHIALLSLNIKKGDEIIIPAFSFPATANVIEIVGGKPIFVDINIDDYCINTEKIEQYITDKTKAIMPVHEFGQVANIEAIQKICKKYNLFLIEDAACALGSEYNNKKAGTFGNIGCYSLHPRKIITTGEGGLIVTNEDKLAEKILLLKNHGIKRRKNIVDFLLPGLNYRMTEFQAIMGLEQLFVIDNNIKTRIDQAKKYNMAFRELDTIILPANFSNRKNIYQTYHIILKKHKRNKIIDDLKNKDIETNYGANALPFLSYYHKKYKFKIKDYLNSYYAYNNGLALPIGPHLSTDNISNIINNLLMIITSGDNKK